MVLEEFQSEAGGDGFHLKKDKNAPQTQPLHQENTKGKLRKADTTSSAPVYEKLEIYSLLLVVFMTSL